MEWIVEFLGERKLLADIRSDELYRIIGPVIQRVEAALNTADPEDLQGLEAILYCESETSWGVRFEGPPVAVHRAVDLFGGTEPGNSSLN